MAGAQAEEHYDIRILRDGTWLYNGTPIARHNLVRLFASVLSRDGAGDFWLTTPAERGRIVVEDAPFIAVAMDVAGSGEDQKISFRTNLDETVILSAAHPLRVAGDIAGDAADPVPYVMVRANLEAKIARPVYYDLVKLAVEKNGVLGVWSARMFHPLGKVSA